MISVQGSLVLIGLNTPNPKVFLEGVQILNIEHIRVDWEFDEQRVKLKFSSITPELQATLEAAGVIVKVSR